MAITTILFFAVIDLVGTAILAFFNISLPIVQVSGGLVIAAIAWRLDRGRAALDDDDEPRAYDVEVRAA